MSGTPLEWRKREPAFLCNLDASPRLSRKGTGMHLGGGSPVPSSSLHCPKFPVRDDATRLTGSQVVRISRNSDSRRQALAVVREDGIWRGPSCICDEAAGSHEGTLRSGPGFAFSTAARWARSGRNSAGASRPSRRPRSASGPWRRRVGITVIAPLRELRDVAVEMRLSELEKKSLRPRFSVVRKDSMPFACARSRTYSLAEWSTVSWVRSMPTYDAPSSV